MTPRTATRLLAALAGAFAIVAMGCSDDAFDARSGGPSNGADSARVNVLGEPTVEIGCEVTLLAETEGGIDSGYEWRTQDDLIATIDNQGVLTALTTGETSVVARGIDTGAVGEHPITVTDERQASASTGPRGGT